MKTFPLADSAAVLTSTYVTEQRLPILYVSHDYDSDEGDSWQFHCGNGDYAMEKLQLVGLATILRLDPGVQELADLPLGFCARRAAPDQPWHYEPEE